MESHVRIDEGVKRGPRRQIREGKLTNPSHPADLGTWQIPDGLNPHEVIQRYLTEATTSQIAQSYGVSRKALTKWLRGQLPVEWREAQILRALTRKEDSEDGLMDAPDALSLARARETLRAAQFDLQALDKDYQPKQEVTVREEIRIEFTLGTEAAALLDQLRTVAETPKQANGAVLLPNMLDRDQVSD